MSETHCPICYTELETRDVAPCYDCGHDPDELRHLAEGQHTYDEVAVLGARAVLCDFCQADFASYDPTYFGRPLGVSVGRDMQRIRAIREPRAGIDKFCPACRRRLAFLRFVVEARAVGSGLTEAARSSTNLAGPWEYQSLRSAIDRLRQAQFRIELSFNVTGRGVVVAGTLVTGRVAVGMVLLVSLERRPDLVIALPIHAVEYVDVHSLHPALIGLVLGELAVASTGAPALAAGTIVDVLEHSPAT